MLLPSLSDVNTLLVLAPGRIPTDATENIVIGNNGSSLIFSVLFHVKNIEVQYFQYTFQRYRQQ